MKIFFVLGFLLISTIILFSFKSNLDLDILSSIIAVATFMLGIFIAFSISDRHNRINRIRELDSEERASLELIYYFSEIFGKKYQDNIQESIDSYLMATLDYKITDYDKTEPNYKNLSDQVFKAEIEKDEKRQEAFDKILSQLVTIGTVRKQTISLVADRLQVYEWSSLILLASVIIFSTVFLNTGVLVLQIILGIINFSILILILFLYSLDNLTWNEEERIFEPYEKTFETIGKLRYYPESLINKRRVKKHKGKSYRLGSFPNPYPDFSGKKIKIEGKE